MVCERPRGGSTACAVPLIPTPYCTCIYNRTISMCMCTSVRHLMLASLALNLVLSHYVGSRVHVGVSEHCMLTMYVLSSTGRYNEYLLSEIL
jgi:hypothetical protein